MTQSNILGYDLNCLTDLTAEMSEIGGRLLLVQSLAHRAMTPRGTLPDVNDPPDPDIANFGYDVSQFLDADLLPGQEGQIAGNLDLEYLKDERVVASSTSVVQSNGALKITTVVQDSAGPFKFVLTVTQYQTLVELVS